MSGSCYRHTSAGCKTFLLHKVQSSFFQQLIDLENEVLSRKKTVWKVVVLDLWNKIFTSIINWQHCATRLGEQWACHILFQQNKKRNLSYLVQNHTYIVCCLATRLSDDFFRRSSNTWLSWYCPSSQFMVVSCFLLAIASLIQRLYRSPSLPIILASSQSVKMVIVHNMVRYCCSSYMNRVPLVLMPVEIFLPQHGVPPDANKTSFQFHKCRTPDSFSKGRNRLHPWCYEGPSYLWDGQAYFWVYSEVSCHWRYHKIQKSSQSFQKFLPGKELLPYLWICFHTICSSFLSWIWEVIFVF